MEEAKLLGAQIVQNGDYHLAVWDDKYALFKNGSKIGSFDNPVRELFKKHPEKMPSYPPYLINEVNDVEHLKYFDDNDPPEYLNDYISYEVLAGIVKKFKIIRIIEYENDYDRSSFIGVTESGHKIEMEYDNICVLKEHFEKLGIEYLDVHD